MKQDFLVELVFDGLGFLVGEESDLVVGEGCNIDAPRRRRCGAATGWWKRRTGDLREGSKRERRDLIERKGI
ncbi:unnamed protein product [Ilex paraguariensis]|uniref:Uncharacterized protein n=1 Tax=Ilex paraguariensis TaxID=185542 RepID=A0ABC8QQZ2_9AQUA